MYTIHIIPVLLSAVAFYYIFETADFLIELIAYSFFSVVVSFGIAFSIALTLPTHTQIEKSFYELSSFEGIDKTSGKFLAKHQTEYSVCILKENGYQIMLIDSKDAYINFTNQEPKLEIQKEVVNNDFINNFSIPLELKVTYIIHIPKGAILESCPLHR